MPAEVKERPILFNAPMVRAILSGSKTQTRRAVRLRGHDGMQPDHAVWRYLPTDSMTRNQRDKVDGGMHMWQHRIDVIRMIEERCPYGLPGDSLWVRENGWERPERTAKMMREGADTWERYYYDADGHTDLERDQFKEWGFKRRPSIHMPRWASRILLEITAVRVERLQDISEADALAEGIAPLQNNPGRMVSGHRPGLNFPSATAAYKDLWEQINGADSWEANPWVWVVEFKRINHA